MKNNLPLIIGISLPIIFIIIISVIIFTPSFFIKPQYSFIYSNDDTYYYNQGYRNTYAIEDNHLVLKPIPVQKDQVYKDGSPTLYVYDVKTNYSHQISLDEAKKYIIDPGPSSPDGYIVKYEYNNEGIFGLFGGSNNSNSGYFIEKDNGKKLLTGLANSSNYYYQERFRLIGWIK